VGASSFSHDDLSERCSIVCASDYCRHVGCSAVTAPNSFASASLKCLDILHATKHRKQGDEIYLLFMPRPLYFFSVHACLEIMFFYLYYVVAYFYYILLLLLSCHHVETHCFFGWRVGGKKLFVFFAKMAANSPNAVLLVAMKWNINFN